MDFRDPALSALLRQSQIETQANRYIYLRQTQNAKIVKLAVNTGQSR